MMVCFRFGRETSLTDVGRAPKASARVMEPWSLAKTATGSRAIGIRPLRFAFGGGAGPREFPATLIAVEVGIPDETAVPPLGDTDGRPHSADVLPAKRAVSSDEASNFRGGVDV
jgi:hypothetical protein